MFDLSLPSDETMPHLAIALEAPDLGGQDFEEDRGRQAQPRVPRNLYRGWAQRLATPAPNPRAQPEAHEHDPDIPEGGQRADPHRVPVASLFHPPEEWALEDFPGKGEQEGENRDVQLGQVQDHAPSAPQAHSLLRWTPYHKRTIAHP